MGQPPVGDRESGPRPTPARARSQAQRRPTCKEQQRDDSRGHPAAHDQAEDDRPTQVARRWPATPSAAHRPNRRLQAGRRTTRQNAALSEVDSHAQRHVWHGHGVDVRVIHRRSQRPRSSMRASVVRAGLRGAPVSCVSPVPAQPSASVSVSVPVGSGICASRARRRWEASTTTSAAVTAAAATPSPMPSGRVVAATPGASAS